MDELWECIIYLQSYFSRPNSQLADNIEDVMQKLRQLFNNHKEYQGIQIGDPAQCFNKLQNLWANKRKSYSQEIREDTLSTLQSIIQGSKSEKRMKTVEDADRYVKSQKQELEYLTQELNKKDITIQMLNYKLDASQRRQNRESDKVTYQRYSMEIKNLKDIIDQLQQQLKEERHSRSSEQKLYTEKEKRLQRQKQSKPFDITRLEQENTQLKQFTQQLLEKQHQMEDQLSQIQQEQVDSKELISLRKENQRIIEENEVIGGKLRQLYDDLELSKKNEMENINQQLERKVSTLTLQLQKEQDDNKTLKLNNEQLKLKMQKLTVTKVPSHFYSVMQIFAGIDGFIELIASDDPVSRLICKIIELIQNERDIPTALAMELLQKLPIDPSVDNRTNDFLFQVVDYIAREIEKPEGSDLSPIAKIIQTKDSPAYDTFFFLQRVLPLDQPIQQNEIPLINSIKHVRNFEAVLKQSKSLTEYLRNLIEFEGQENVIEDQEATPFTFLVFPKMLIMNVVDLSYAKAEISIDLQFNSSILNNTTDYTYRLMTIIQYFVNAENVPIYQAIVRHGDTWLLHVNDSFKQVQVERYLTFKRNAVELLIFERQQ